MTRMPDEIPVKVTAELESAWVVRPGDKLVLGFARRLNMAEVDKIRERFALMLPGVEVILADGITGMAVYRDEPPGAAANTAGSAPS